MTEVVELGVEQVEVRVGESDESILDIFEKHYEDFSSTDIGVEKFDGQGYLLFYSKPAFMQHEKGEKNATFESLVRDLVPFAPQFNGVVVLVCLEKYVAETFLAACKTKWEKKPEPEALPQGLVRRL